MGWLNPAAIRSRREAERDLFRHGRYPGGTIPVWAVDRGGRVDFSRPIRRLTEADVAPRVQAKTGFINGAASLSGRVISRNGQRYAFAFLMNTDRIGEAQQLQDRVVALLARGAEDTGRTR